MYRVLIVEDEMFVRVGLRNSIRWDKFGMTVVGDAANGLDALKLYEQEKPDLIITDLKMPVMDGMKLIERVRSKDWTTKIVILTCLEEFEMVRKAISYGVTNYILKLTMTPDDMEQVLEKVSLDMKRDYVPVTPFIDESVLIDTIYKDYMFRRLYSDKEFEEFLGKMERPLSSHRLQMLLFEIDHFEILQQRFKDNKGKLVNMSLLNVLHEVLRSYNRGVLIHDELNRFILILSFHDVASEQKAHTLLNEIVEHIQKVMSKFFNVTVTFCASEIRSGFHHLSAQYKENIKLLGKKFVLGTGIIIKQSEWGAKPYKERMAGQLARLPQYSESLHNEAFQRQLQTKINHLLHKDTDFTKNQILNFLIQMMQMPIVFFPINSEEVYDLSIACQQQLEKCESLEEAIGMYAEYMEVISLHVQSLNKYSPEIKNAFHYIHQHFDQNITLQQLSDAVRMSPNYFSYLFKKETGRSLVDYTNQFRIEKAKQFLLDTHLKSYEVAEKVGFSDHSYFSRIFKKETGTSPKHFRRQWLKDWVEESGNEVY